MSERIDASEELGHLLAGLRRLRDDWRASPDTLLRLYAYYGDAFTVECPTGSERQCNLLAAAQGQGGPAPAATSSTTCTVPPGLTLGECQQDVRVPGAVQAERFV